MAEPNPTALADHRHAEIVEALGRVNLALEALHQQGEIARRQRIEATARLDSILKWLITTWQAARDRQRTAP